MKESYKVLMSVIYSFKYFACSLVFSVFALSLGWCE